MSCLYLQQPPSVLDKVDLELIEPMIILSLLSSHHRGADIIGINNCIGSLSVGPGDHSYQAYIITLLSAKPSHWFHDLSFSFLRQGFSVAMELVLELTL